MSAGAPLPALIVTHGGLGQALLATAEGIAGKLDGVEVLANSGLSRDALRDEVAARVRAFGPRGGIVFVDVAGGSCAQASLAVAARSGEGPVAVVSGVNLPMLLDFATNRTGADPAALAARVAVRGQSSVLVLEVPGGAR